MRRMSTVGEWSYWNSLARDRPAEPFELAVLGSFPVLLGAGFSSMFHTETVTAVRTWSSRNGYQSVAMFLSLPDPEEYCAESGIFGGIVVDGKDEPADIEAALFSAGPDGVPMSIYDVSHRFVVIPEDASWILMGDRDADVALYGFVNDEARQDFMCGAPDLIVFASLEEAARYAKSFMNYDLAIP